MLAICVAYDHSHCTRTLLSGFCRASKLRSLSNVESLFSKNLRYLSPFKLPSIKYGLITSSLIILHQTFTDSVEEMRGDSLITSTPMVRGEGIHRNEAPQRKQTTTTWLFLYFSTRSWPVCIYKASLSYYYAKVNQIVHRKNGDKGVEINFTFGSFQLIPQKTEESVTWIPVL